MKSVTRIFLIAILLFLFLRSAAAGQNQVAPFDRITGGEFTYIIQRGDTLTSIGARFGVGVGILAADNNLASSSLLKVGQRLSIDNRHIVLDILKDGIVINIPQRMLFYFSRGRLARSFPVGLGPQGLAHSGGSVQDCCERRRSGVGCPGVNPGRNAPRRQRRKDLRAAGS